MALLKYSLTTLRTCSSVCQTSALNYVRRRDVLPLAARVFACVRWTSHHRGYSSEVIPEASVSGQPKDFSPKIQKLVQDISDLTLLEVADLNELLKKTLNISDAPMMPMGGMVAAAPAAAEEEEEAETKQEKTFFTVKLTGFDDTKKVALIKQIKNLIPGMNLVQAKKFVESTPQNVQGELTKQEAEDLKKALEEAGGKTEID